MKYFLIITSLFFVTSCATETLEQSTRATPVHANQAQSHTLYVDVREPSEWQTGHIEGAILVPLGEIEAGKFDKIPKDTPVSLYCRSSRRSGIAYDILKKAGYTNITNIGGINQVSGVQIVK